jgi:hypothetical protein
LLRVGNAADRAVGRRRVGGIVREANDRAADEVHADDLVPPALLAGQQTDCDRPLVPRRVSFRLDEWRHRRVWTQPLRAERRPELGILREQPHGLVELGSRRRRLLAGFDDLHTATIVRGVDHERPVLAVVEDRRPVRDRLRRRQAPGSLSLLLLDGLQREQTTSRATEASCAPMHG